MKCPCNYCSTPLEFTEELVGTEIECPSCSNATILFNPTQKQESQPERQRNLRSFKMTEGTWVLITLLVYWLIYIRGLSEMEILKAIFVAAFATILWAANRQKVLNPTASVSCHQCRKASNATYRPAGNAAIELLLWIPLIDFISLIWAYEMWMYIELRAEPLSNASFKAINTKQAAMMLEFLGKPVMIVTTIFAVIYTSKRVLNRKLRCGDCDSEFVELAPVSEAPSASQ